MEDQIVKSLAVSPHDSNTIFVGTKPAYMYLSRDGGQSWDELTGFRRVPWRWWWEPHPMKRMPISLATDPNTPGHLYARLTSGEVWFTADYGDTWGKLPFNIWSNHRMLVVVSG